MLKHARTALAALLIALAIAAGAGQIDRLQSLIGAQPLTVACTRC